MPNHRNWILRLNNPPGAERRLFCFPYAGNGAAAYFHWAERMPKEIEVCPVELPGRGKRFREPLYYDFSALIGELAAAIADYLDKPFSFFGHSMGALISFELARCLKKEYGVSPELLCVSGCPAPHLYRSEVQISSLSDQDLLLHVRQLNGLPDEILQNQELLQIFLPILRADFSLCDSFVYREDQHLSCPVIVFGGLDDPNISSQELYSWRQITEGFFKIYRLPGDHFYLLRQEEILTRILTLLFNMIHGISIPAAAG